MKTFSQDSSLIIEKKAPVKVVNDRRPSDQGRVSSSHDVLLDPMQSVVGVKGTAYMTDHDQSLDVNSAFSMAMTHVCMNRQSPISIFPPCLLRL